MISGSPFIERCLWAAIVAVLFAIPTRAADNASLANPPKPLHYTLAAGRVTMTLSHPFRIVIAKSREFEGEFEWAGEKSGPPARMSVDAKLAGFTATTPELTASLQSHLETKRFPMASFRTRGVDLRASSRNGLKRMLLYGELTLHEHMVEVRIPLECAIAPDFSQCRFEKTLSLRDLQIPVPRRLGIPSRGWIELSGQFEFVRKGGGGT